VISETGSQVKVKRMTRSSEKVNKFKSAKKRMTNVHLTVCDDAKRAESVCVGTRSQQDRLERASQSSAR
jgi:hypothetical protein